MDKKDQKKDLGPSWPYLLGLFWLIAWFGVLIHYANLPPGEYLGFFAWLILFLPIAAIAAFFFY
ncbi:MAG: hypothetical protein JF626_03805 [Polaromonas sp.]|nr:hypothetical protein [Polaromonas sp.]